MMLSMTASRRFYGYMSKGTYIYLEPSPNTISALEQFCVDMKFTMPVKPTSLHSTLIYCTNTPFESKPLSDDTHCFSSRVFDLELWKCSTTKRTLLVLTFVCPELQERHSELKLEEGFTHSFDDFKPHITLAILNKKTEINLDSLRTELSNYLNEILLIAEHRRSIYFYT